jgi:hypothetical protein
MIAQLFELSRERAEQTPVIVRAHNNGRATLSQLR